MYYVLSLSLASFTDISENPGTCKYSDGRVMRANDKSMEMISARDTLGGAFGRRDAAVIHVTTIIIESVLIGWI